MRFPYQRIQINLKTLQKNVSFEVVCRAVESLVSAKQRCMAVMLVFNVASRILSPILSAYFPVFLHPIKFP